MSYVRPHTHDMNKAAYNVPHRESAPGQQRVRHASSSQPRNISNPGHAGMRNPNQTMHSSMLGTSPQSIYHPTPQPQPAGQPQQYIYSHQAGVITAGTPMPHQHLPPQPMVFAAPQHHGFAYGFPHSNGNMYPGFMSQSAQLPQQQNSQPVSQQNVPTPANRPPSAPPLTAQPPPSMNPITGAPAYTTPPSMQSQLPPQQQPQLVTYAPPAVQPSAPTSQPLRRVKKPLAIVDPNTNKPVDIDDSSRTGAVAASGGGSGGGGSGSDRSTPPVSVPEPPHVEDPAAKTVQNQFKNLVLAAKDNTGAASGAAATPAAPSAAVVASLSAEVFVPSKVPDSQPTGDVDRCVAATESSPQETAAGKPQETSMLEDKEEAEPSSKPEASTDVEASAPLVEAPSAAADTVDSCSVQPSPVSTTAVVDAPTDSNKKVPEHISQPSPAASEKTAQLPENAQEVLKQTAPLQTSVVSEQKQPVSEEKQELSQQNENVLEPKRDTPNMNLVPQSADVASAGVGVTTQCIDLGKAVSSTESTTAKPSLPQENTTSGMVESPATQTKVETDVATTTEAPVSDSNKSVVNTKLKAADEVKVVPSQAPSTQVPPSSKADLPPSTKPAETVRKVTLPTDSELMPPPAAPLSSPPSPSKSPSISSAAVTVSPIENKENSPVSTNSQVSTRSSSANPAYKYKEDPEMPVNPEKKRVYDRNFLMSLKDAPPSTQKPAGLSDILQDLLISPNMSRQHSQGSMSSSSSRSNLFVNSHSQSSPRPSSSRSKPKDMGGPRNSRQGPPVKEIDYKRNTEVKLNKVENAWKPGAATADLSEEDKVHKDLLKKFRGILNKITPQKFESLLSRVLELPVKSEIDLDGVMNLVFEKAINEPGFSVTYAALCQKIAKEFTVPSKDNPDSKVNFRKLLLCRCQKEFEESDKDDREIVAKQEALDKATGDEKAKLKEVFDSFLTKARRRKLGNIRFIGELFKLGMLVPKIMHDCIITLLKSGDEESLECLCRLLTTIGKELDINEAKMRNDQYFAEMKKISTSKNKKVSSRIRFAIQDVLELRQNNWVPRRENSNPKTITQIHAEAALEAHQKQMTYSQLPPSRGSQNRGPPPPRDREVRNRDRDNDGWNHVGSSGQGKSQRIEPSKLKLSRQSNDMQLGPAKGFGPGSSWGKGSSGSGKNTPPQQEERPHTPGNKFAALSDRDGSDPRSRSGQRLPSRGSMGRGSIRDRDRYSITPRGSMEKERSSAIGAARQLSSRQGGSRGPSRDSSLEGRNMRPPTPTRGASASATAPSNVPSKTVTPPVITTPSVKQLSRDEWTNKMKSTLDELLHNKDLKEALACIEELGAQQDMYLLTECSINHVLERTSAARKQTGHFFAELIKKQILPLDTHVKGLNSILEFADDLAIDIPNVWQYLGELMAPMFFEADVSLVKLEEMCKPLVNIGKAAILAVAILEEASHSVGHVEVGKKWRVASLKWSSFLKPDQSEEEFIGEKKLEYTVSSSTSAGDSTTGSSELSQSNLNHHLNRLLVQETASNEAVFDWIDVNVSESCRTSDAQFVQALAYHIFKASVAGEEKLMDESLKSRSPLLVKYLDGKAEREAAALTGLEELIDQLQHPAELLSNFCYLLAETDDCLISDDSFLLWEKNSKNGTAIKSLKKFFQWIRDADTEKTGGSS